jgi:peptide/nickel transport system permease protein
VWRYIVQRLASGLLVILGVLVITFLIGRVIPGDPARLYAGGVKASPQEVARARVELGLNRPLPVQFVDYVKGLLHGDLGISYVTRRPVLDDLKQFVPATLELVIPAMLFALLVGIPVGLLAGTRPGTWVDRISRLFSISGAALPTFWLAILAQIVVGLKLGLLPIGGEESTATTLNHPVKDITGFLPVDALITGNWSAAQDVSRHAVLPILILALYPLCLIIRQTRASAVGVMSETYVTAARAAGLPERIVRFRFALKNALLPTLTVVGLTFAGLLTGTVLIEVIFSWPGVGSYVTNAILSSDYAPIQAVTLLGAIAYVIVNLIVDVVQAALDPRVRTG